jgi:hypothetical protein
MRTRTKSPSGVEQSTAIQPALDLKPDAIYLPSQVIAALQLRSSSLRSEWRAGRLRVLRRCGKNYLLGRDILVWLNGGELPSPSNRNGDL